MKNEKSIENGLSNFSWPKTPLKIGFLTFDERTHHLKAFKSGFRIELHGLITDLIFSMNVFVKSDYILIWGKSGRIFKIRQKMISRCHPAWSPYRLSCQRRVRRQRPTLSCGTPVPMTFLSHWCKASKLRWRILRKMLRRTLTPLPELTLFCHIIEDLGQVHRQAYLRLSIGQRTKRKGMYWNTNTDIQINYDHVGDQYWRKNTLYFISTSSVAFLLLKIMISQVEKY